MTVNNKIRSQLSIIGRGCPSPRSRRSHGAQCPTPLAAVSTLVKVFASVQPMLSNSAGSHNTIADIQTGDIQRQIWRNPTAQACGEAADAECRGRLNRLVRTRAERLQLTLELGERARQLLAPCGM